jgi:hypothetical protein
VVLTGGRADRPVDRSHSPTPTPERKVPMKLVRKIVIGFGSIAALMLAGGAHFKVN